MMKMVLKKRKENKFISVMKDTWEALGRNSLYKDDFGKFKVEVKEDPVNALKKFRDKWFISPLDPSLTFEQILERWERGAKLGYKRRSFPMEILHRRGEENFPVFIDYPSLTSEKINLTINTKSLKADIMSAIDSLLEFHRRLNLSKGWMKEKKSRRREMSVDPWLVYDMYREERISLLQITRKLFNITSHPAYDNRADSLYKQVKRAYQKAQSMIKAINPN